MKNQITSALLFLSLSGSTFACGYIDIKDLDFPTNQHGFRLTTMGMEETADGGTTWTDIHPGIASDEDIWNYDPYLQLEFVDAEHGFLVAMPVRDEPAKILVTQDGGMGWEAHPLLAGMEPRMVDFTDALHGFCLLTDNRLLVTYDAGVTWNDVAAAPANLNIETMSMISTTRGFAIASQNIMGLEVHMLLITLDGGRHWKRKVLSTSGAARFTVQTLPGGNAVVSNGKELTLVNIETLHWTTLFRSPSQTQRLGQVAFRDDRTGVVSAGHELYLTTDGGRTFSLIQGYSFGFSTYLAFSPDLLKVVNQFSKDNDIELPAPTQD